MKTLWNWLAARKAARSVVDSVIAQVAPPMVESLEDRCFLSVTAPHVTSFAADNRGLFTIKLDQKLNPASVSSKSVKVWKVVSGHDQAITNAGISYSATKRTITVDAKTSPNTVYKVRLISKLIKGTTGLKLDGEFKPSGKSGNGRPGGDWFAMTAPRAAGDQIARMRTDWGDILVEMFEEKTATVANFTGYANDTSWDGVIFHRSAFVDTDPNTFDPFVLQGGAFKVDASNRYTLVHTNPPTITNEPGISNLKGTIAMARVSGGVNSATDQFFFNMKDNTFLDNVDQGFTVFGKTNTAGMNILTKIMKSTINANATGAGAAGFFVNAPRDQGAFTDVPVKTIQNFSPSADSVFIRRLSMMMQVAKGVRA